MSTRVLPKFSLLIPQSLNEALGIADKLGDRARFLAGGTDLIVKMKIGAIEPEILIGIKKIKELRTISYDRDSGLAIGTLATYRDLFQSPAISASYPILHDVTYVFANEQLLNMGTVGGNICNASPAGDLIPVFLVLGASVDLLSPAGIRSVRLADFFVGPGKTVLRPGELLSRITVPALAADVAGCFLRIARTAEDLAKVSAAAVFAVREGEFADVRLALGAVAPTVIRLPEIEAFLEGRPADDGTIETAVGMVAKLISPITDLRSTAKYRAKVAGIALKRAINQCISRRPDL
jgi:aerobic carbon-monoxide dehydrogenase medium subunit